MPAGGGVVAVVEVGVAVALASLGQRVTIERPAGMITPMTTVAMAVWLAIHKKVIKESMVVTVPAVVAVVVAATVVAAAVAVAAVARATLGPSAPINQLAGLIIQSATVKRAPLAEMTGTVTKPKVMISTGVVESMHSEVYRVVVAVAVAEVVAVAGVEVVARASMALRARNKIPAGLITQPTTGLVMATEQTS